MILSMVMTIVKTEQIKHPFKIETTTNSYGLIAYKIWRERDRGQNIYFRVYIPLWRQRIEIEHWVSKPVL